MCKAHALLLLWHGLLPAIAYSSSAKPAHEIHISYDGRASSKSRSPDAPLIRRSADLLHEDLPGDAEDVEKSGTSPEESDWYIEDLVENTIAKAQTTDFDKQREQMLRHVHYTAATSPTGSGQGAPKDSWHISGTGATVPDDAEARIVQSQLHAEKQALPEDFEQRVKPLVVNKTVVHATAIPLNLPSECKRAPKHAIEFEDDETCPDACPLLAEDTEGEQHCYFKCVTKTECGVPKSGTNLAQSVPDMDVGFCRRCSVPGCRLCNRTAHSDVCGDCHHGFILQDGACVFQVPIIGTLAQSLLYFALLIPVAYFIIWYVSLARRKKVNLEEETQALQFRTQTKLCAVESITEEAPAEERQLWPLKTNTLKVPVAGPGSVLFFRYQVFIMLLALVLLVLWVLFICLTNGSLSALGTEDPKSPRELCTVIHQGYETQQRYMSAKSSFILTAYMTSFVLCILFAIHQRRTFNRLNIYPTHADFMALLDGLPAIAGSEPLEELLKAELEKATSQEIVGVSVGWHMGEHGEQIRKVLEEDVLALEDLKREQEDKKDAAETEVQTFSRQRPKWLRMFDKVMLTGILGIDTVPPPPEEVQAALAAQAAPSGGAGDAQKPEKPEAKEATKEPESKEKEAEKKESEGKEKEAEKKDPEGKETEKKTEGAEPLASSTSESPEALCNKIQSSPMALVVFKTETGRDDALQKCQSITFSKETVKFRPLVTEPMGVQWENMAITPQMRRERLSASVKLIVMASAAWTVCFYLPYALYASSFSYSNGDKPSAMMSVSLTVIVVLGNLIMYTFCAEAAQRVGHMLRDTQEGVYMVLYTFAILFNILLDAAVGGYIAYRTAVANHARTYGGILVEDLTRAQAIFESFEIQRQLSLQVFKYCFPSMFLIPFIGEAVAANWFTLHLARLVVTTFPHIKGYKAQQALKIFVPMDSGRYADVLINIAAAVLIFFLPGGYTVALLVGLLVSHVFIICFDHFRVLRCVPSFCFSSSVVDDYAQLLLIIPCALMLTAFVQKYNCSTDSICIQDSSLGFTLLAVFLLHCAMHWSALKTLVPKFGDVKEHVPTKLSYQEVAAKIAPSWFNLNPGFCLRSKYFYKHEKPCTLLVQGREHVLRKSDQATAFFEDSRRVAKEEYKQWKPQG